MTSLIEEEDEHDLTSLFEEEASSLPLEIGLCMSSSPSAEYDGTSRMPALVQGGFGVSVIVLLVFYLLHLMQHTSLHCDILCREMLPC